MIGQVVSRYKIVEKLGEGGMGVVYKAEDTELKRDVAIKFLPRQIAASEEERRRFKVEAQAAAALNHPNIATIYNIEEVDDEMFIVMEYIEGKELKEKVESGPLPIEEILEVLLQIAKGLRAAHDKGIVHRDIKSANIMITDEGDVKSMDFGLAKVRGGAGVTKLGTTLGTAAYMSPEQARGEEADHRSDIWSFGVVLYEMLTGKLPFGGDYEQAVMYAIMNEEPPLTEEVPSNLQAILQKALAKDQTERYQNIDELHSDLKSSEESSTSRTKAARKVSKQGASNKTILYLGGAVVLIALLAVAYFLNRSQPIDSIAVMPFVNANNDPAIEYLSDGITETLITKLSQLPQLKVMARSTVFRFKGKDMTPQQIGEQLNVPAVLTGEIVQRGDVLRLVAELVDVSDGTQIWGKQYNRSMDDIFAVQDAISEQISTSLKLKLSGDDKNRLVKRHTEDTEAYQLYLKGRFYWNQRTAEALKTALGYFQQAIDRDSTYAAAYAGLSDCYGLFPYYAVSPTIEAIPKAKSAALKALQIDAQLVEAHTSLASAYQSEWEWELSDKSFRRAIELNPNYATARHWYAGGLLFRGHFEEAIAEFKGALTVDPHSLIINVTLGHAYIMARRYDLALEHLQKTLSMDQNFFVTHFNSGVAYVLKNQTAKGIEHLKEALRLSDSPEVLATIGYTYGISGNIEEAEKTLVEMDKLSSKRFVSPYHVAMIYAGLGER
jgi:serine/threonine-protein kinase